LGEAADVVRAAFERANADDPDGLAALCDEAVEFHDVPEIPGSTVYRGHDGIRIWLRTVREISDDLELQIRGLAERQDAVLVETSAQMSGRASGAEVDWRFWTVWRVRDGLITYYHGHSRREDAVADLESG
jgi:ketosteroid isomerase-like protein